MCEVEYCLLYFERMADKNENALDKAESVARRILERLGSKLDSKLEPTGRHALGARQISDLTGRVERAIEAALRNDKNDAAKVAPNRFKVLLTYEETSSLTPEYMEAVGKELTSTVREYVNNRRYKTSGPIVVEVGRDLFAKGTLVKAEFSSDGEGSSPDAAQTTGTESQKPAAATKMVLEDAKGRSYRLALELKGSPSCIGRAAGNALRIDDASISRIHCSLALRESGEVVVADLGSANGTFVNQGLLGSNEARPVEESDVIRVGDVTLTVSKIA
ncbi:MAG TPA: FhaA domain-containing protein [Blastocatellia bacterium]|nr:FhaA domain-containing protein [Blastocatellia bacterium]